jgi:hypothetical protein
MSDSVWIVWSTDDNHLVACTRDHLLAMDAAAKDCGCDDIGWTVMDDGWTYLNNLWGYIIRRCVIKENEHQPGKRRR